MCWPRVGAGPGSSRSIAPNVSGEPPTRTLPIPGWSMSRNTGLASDTRQSSVEQLGERLVGAPADAVAVERLGDRGQRAVGDPRGDEGGQRVARPVAIALPGEVDLERPLDRREVLADADGVDQRLPLAQADGDDHHPAVVGGREVAAERPVHVVADRRAGLAEHLGLGEVAEVGDHRERDVGERHRHELADAGAGADPLGGEQPERGGEPGGDVPRRQHVVRRQAAAASARWRRRTRTPG